MAIRTVRRRHPSRRTRLRPPRKTVQISQRPQNRPLGEKTLLMAVKPTPAGPGRHEPARSSHQPHQQAFLKYQQQQQQQQQQMQNNQKDLQPRSRSTRAAAVAATAAVSTSNNSGGGNMVLDPETGEMVPAGSDGEENYEDEEYEDEDDVQVIQSAKPVLINLGQLKNSSSSSSTSKNNLQVCVWSLVIFLFFNLF